MAKKAKKLKISRDKGLHQRIVFLTDVDQQDRLQAHSEASGMPIATIMRRALDAYLKAAQ